MLKVEEDASDPKSNAENFIFYQTPTKWVFRTLDSLLRQDPVDKFFLAEAAKNDTKKGEGEGSDTGIFPHQNISGLTVKNQLDTVKNLEQGLYAHVVKTIDPLMKKFTEDAWSWAEHFAELTHIEDEP